MNIECLTLGPIETNCYILWNDDKQALVIDPAAEAQRILEVLDTHQLTVVAYPLTHGHIDHISALAEVHEKHPAAISMHPKDASWAFTAQNALLPFYQPPSKIMEINRLLDDGQEWLDAKLRYKIIFSPGHTPGSVSFYFPDEDILFPGDALFRGSVGRTDLPGGDSTVLAQSLSRLKDLPAETKIYPGHGPTSTMEFELQHNPFLQ